MAKAPAFQFYTGDWLKDPNLGQCSASTRGIWIDMLALMHENGRSGELHGSTVGLAQICRCSVDQMELAIAELDHTGTASVTLQNGKVTVINRRMATESLIRKQAAKRAGRHRERKKKRGDNAEVTPCSSTSTSVPTNNVTVVCEGGAELAAAMERSERHDERARERESERRESERIAALRGQFGSHARYCERLGETRRRGKLSVVERGREDVEHYLRKGGHVRKG